MVVVFVNKRIGRYSHIVYLVRLRCIPGFAQVNYYSIKKCHYCLIRFNYPMDPTRQALRQNMTTWVIGFSNQVLFVWILGISDCMKIPFFSDRRMQISTSESDLMRISLTKHTPTNLLRWRLVSGGHGVRATGVARQWIHQCNGKTWRSTTVVANGHLHKYILCWFCGPVHVSILP